MVAIGDAHKGNAMPTRAPGRFLFRQGKCRVSQPMPGINQRSTATFIDDARCRLPIRATIAQKRCILRHARQPVPRLPSGFGGDQRGSGALGHFRPGTASRECRRDKLFSLNQGKSHQSAFNFTSCTSLAQRSVSALI